MKHVAIVDHLLAIGGTAKASVQLAKQLGAEIVGLAFVIELDALKGRDKLIGYDVLSLIHYPE
jgi:adenine phosphoribosyltransferase